MTARIFRYRLESVAVVVESNAASVAYLGTECEIVRDHGKSEGGTVSVDEVSGEVSLSVIAELLGDTVEVLLSEGLKAVVLLDHTVPARNYAAPELTKELVALLAVVEVCLSFTEIAQKLVHATLCTVYGVLRTDIRPQIAGTAVSVRGSSECVPAVAHAKGAVLTDCPLFYVALAYAAMCKGRIFTHYITLPVRLVPVGSSGVG